MASEGECADKCSKVPARAIPFFLTPDQQGKSKGIQTIPTSSIFSPLHAGKIRTCGPRPTASFPSHPCTQGKPWLIPVFLTIFHPCAQGKFVVVHGRTRTSGLLTPARREHHPRLAPRRCPGHSHPCPAGNTPVHFPPGRAFCVLTPARRGNPSTREATRFLMLLTPARRENPTRRGSFEGIQDSHPCAQGKPSLPFQSLPPPASHPCTQGKPSQTLADLAILTPARRGCPSRAGSLSSIVSFSPLHAGEN